MHPEFGAWHSVEMMGLRAGANFASNEIFATEEEAHTAASLIDSLYRTYSGTHIDHEEIQNIYTTWKNDSIRNTGYGVAWGCAYNALNEIPFEKPVTEQKVERIKSPIQLSRRDFLKLGGMASSAYAAYQYTAAAMDVPPLSRSIPKIQNPMYREFPVSILERLRDSDNFQRLYSFISPQNLSADAFFTSRPISEEIYNDAKAKTLAIYEDGLSNHQLEAEKKQALQVSIDHLNPSTYNAYAKRLGYALWALGHFGAQIPEVGPSDPLLSITLENNEPILDSGIGLAVNFVIRNNQKIYHNTQVSSTN
jgi:hypothetical protein